MRDHGRLVVSPAMVTGWHLRCGARGYPLADGQRRCHIALPRPVDRLLSLRRVAMILSARSSAMTSSRCFAKVKSSSACRHSWQFEATNGELVGFSSRPPRPKRTGLSTDLNTLTPCDAIITKRRIIALSALAKRLFPLRMPGTASARPEVL